MKKSLNGTLVLFGVFAVLLGWYLLFEKKIRPDRDKKADDAKHLVQIERDTIQEIEVDRKKIGKPGEPVAYETYRLKKTGSDWNLAAPIEDEADSAAVGTMLATFTSTQNERTVTDAPKDLAQFELQDPPLKVRGRKDSSSPWTEIRVGADTAVGFNSYVQLGDKPTVYTASRNLKTTFDKDPSTVRNKKLFKFSRNDIVSAEVQTAKDTYVLSKADDGDNWILARTGLPADSGEVNKTLNTLVDAKIKEFADDTGKQTAKFGLAKPMATLTVDLGRDKKKVTVFAGKAGDRRTGEKYYVKHSEKPGIFEVEKEIGERLQKTASEYRNLQIAKFNRFTLTKLKIDHKEPVELVKKGNDWEVPGEADFKVDAAQVDNLLTNLQDVKAKDFIPKKSVEKDLKTPILTLHLFEKEGDKDVEKHTMVFARRFNKVFATRTGLDVAMELTAADLSKIEMGKSAFKKTEGKAEIQDDKKSEDKKTTGKTG